KFCMLLCLVAVSFSMAACGNDDVQSQMPVDRTESDRSESPMEERTPVSDISEGPEKEELENAENEKGPSGDTGSAEAESDGVSESDITDGAESMTGLTAVESEAETVTGTAPETEAAGAETGTRNGNDEEKTAMNMKVQVGDAVFSATLEENEAV
ncbi:MAG TPA: hypothetical protein DCZ91_10315, partial [Lachnospiraceae bacterium]|nr:hypothetical protein [Lachnospiraceae bacterium]